MSHLTVSMDGMDDWQAEVRKEQEDYPLEQRINRARCDLCGAVIVSVSGHDQSYCSCENLFVDGGPYYLRRGWEDPRWTEMSIGWPPSEFSRWSAYPDGWEVPGVPKGPPAPPPNDDGEQSF